MILQRVWFYLKWILLGCAAVLVVLVAVRAWLIHDKAGLQIVLSDPSTDLMTAAAEMPDGSGRFLVLEKSGRVVWFKPPADRIGGVVGDLRGKVKISSWEDGLLSVAFHPRFKDNGYVYLFYSAAPPLRSVLVRYSLDPAGPTLKPGSEQVILTIPKEKPDHNGGSLVFGLDGYLYVSVGDGNTSERATDLKSLLGSVLRIDVDHPTGGRPYGIPVGNPWADGKEGARPELWAKGLRNLWRMSYDAKTQLLIGGDVGEKDEEEIDIIRGGFDYGWERVEGDFCRVPSGCDNLDTALPYAAFPRFIIRAIIGGFVYRGKALPNLRGHYVFGDYFRGVYDVDTDAKPTIHWPGAVVYQPFSDSPKNKNGRLFIASFAQDSKGELYVVELAGAIYKIVPIHWWQGWLN